MREPESEEDIWWSDGSNGSPNFEMDDRRALPLRSFSKTL